MKKGRLDIDIKEGGEENSVTVATAQFKDDSNMSVNSTIITLSVELGLVV